MAMPNPLSFLTDGKKAELPAVEQLGIIEVATLNLYHCNNPDRRLLSLFGVVYDVSSADKSYGPDGAYKEYAGHDVTLALSKSKTDEVWLDRFVKMDAEWIKSVEGWASYYEHKYPVCAKLDKWVNENPEEWPELTAEERQQLEKGCTIM